MVEKNMECQIKQRIKTVENIINEEVSVLEASMKRLEINIIAEPLSKRRFQKH